VEIFTSGFWGLRRVRSPSAPHMIIIVLVLTNGY